MDVRILRALATSALYPYLEGRDGSDGCSHNGGNDPNGAEFPASVADAVLDVPSKGNWFFTIGFEFALDVAAAISEDPAHSPDLSAAIAKAKEEIAEAARGRAA